MREMFYFKSLQLPENNIIPHVHSNVCSFIFSITVFLLRCNYEKIISVIHRFYVPHSVMLFPIQGKNNDMIILHIKYELFSLFLFRRLHSAVFRFSSNESTLSVFVQLLFRPLLADCFTIADTNWHCN